MNIRKVLNEWLQSEENIFIRRDIMQRDLTFMYYIYLFIFIIIKVVYCLRKVIALMKYKHTLGVY